MKVRSRAKVAARRLPLEDEDRRAEEDQKEEGGGERVVVEAIDADKVKLSSLCSCHSGKII